MRSGLWSSAVCCALAVCLLLGGAPTHRAAGEKLSIGTKPLVVFTSYRLANGMRVVLAPDHSVPVIGLCVAYGVGSVDEQPNQSGLAHLCEHLMSQGSSHVGRDEHHLLIEEAGGTFNATTSQDVTEYYEMLPANQLDLALFLEADRMGSLKITQSSFENQRGVVEAEKRERHDDQIYTDLQPTVLRLGYTRFGYGHPTIGDNAGLESATLEQAQAFFHAYYMPNNAVLALTGDFDPAAARALIEKMFGPISAGTLPTPPQTDEPTPLKSGRAALTDQFDSLPCYEIAYRAPTMPHPDDAALSLLADILGTGRSSRFGQALIESRAAITARASLRDRRGPGLFVIWATLPPREDFTAVVSDIDTIVAQIQKDGVTAEELERAKAYERNSEALRLYSAMYRARDLAGNAVVQGDPETVNSDLTREERVTPADIQRVARQYLQSDHRVAVTVVPYNDSRASSRFPL